MDQRSDLMNKKTVKIVNQSGLHARPASVFVQQASKFKSHIEILHQGRIFNAKSIMAILSSGLVCGTEIEISADGPDEEVAVNSLAALVASKFGE